jgi:predicted methyltransferase
MTTPIALDAAHIETLLGRNDGESTLDLPCTVASVRISGNWVSIAGRRISRAELARGRETPGTLYTIADGRLNKLQFFGGHAYKLAPTGGYPALEIDGIRMHRSKDIPPEEEARLKVDCLSARPNLRVLDICTGLGYSAQELATRGARVVSLEKDPSVIEIAGLNPCSSEFFRFLKKGDIALVICEAERFIRGIPDGTFHRVIHDPPTFSLAGQLYSLEFYREIHRIMKGNGVLLHYTGQPGSRYRRKDLRRGVSQRLRSAGFSTEWLEEARSVRARRIAGRDRGR